jgi:coenzyme F420-reducing hydrogenase beta subunit
MKSKYVWSDVAKAYKDVVRELQNGREVMFAGTPCQVAAIKSLTKGCDGKLLTVDFVCHGTPRVDMFASYMDELEKQFGGKCIDYDFRDKRMGWNFPRVHARFSNGRKYDVVMRRDPWYLGFALNMTLREGCFSCPYTTLARVSDFTIADCWRVAASHPEWDDNKGTSLVLVNTDKALSVWNDIAVTGKVAFGEYDIDLAQMRNMPLMQGPTRPKMYDKVQNAFDTTGSFAAAAKCFMSWKLSWRANIVFWVKKIGWVYFRRKQ